MNHSRTQRPGSRGFVLVGNSCRAFRFAASRACNAVLIGSQMCYCSAILQDRRSLCFERTMCLLRISGVPAYLWILGSALIAPIGNEQFASCRALFPSQLALISGSGKSSIFFSIYFTTLRVQEVGIGSTRLEL